MSTFERVKVRGSEVLEIEPEQLSAHDKTLQTVKAVSIVFGRNESLG